MKALSNNARNQNDFEESKNLDTNMISRAGEEDQEMGDDDRTYDEFAAISFQVEWVQKIWDVTGHLYYHEESMAFLEPVTPEDLGGMYAY
jgi:hypothetical protein